jgi:ABC-2 type transport system permease protein
MLLLFLVFGILIGSVARISFPNITYNSPYAINFILGLFSLACLFPITITASQCLLREKEYRFEQILYSTPITTGKYFISRFLLVFGIAVLSFLIFLSGFISGHLMRMDSSELWGAFHISYYIHSFLIIVIPNIFLCSVIVSCTAWLSKNKFAVYLSGLGIYVVYMVVSIYSNSPLMAGASPVSESAMQLAAKTDPFGMAAFFEQTNHWTSSERNSVLLQLSGNVLFNRVSVIIFSSVLLFISFKIFRFKVTDRNRKISVHLLNTGIRNFSYVKTETNTSGFSYFLNTIFSFLKIDLKSTVKSIPFVILILITLFVLGMEIYGAIEGGIRLPENYVTSALMINTILSTLPVLLISAVLFYGSEMVWKSRSVNFDSIENTTSFSHSVLLVSKILSIICISFILIFCCIVMSLAFQIIYQYPLFDLAAYTSLFYFIGIPALLCGILIVAFQFIIGNKYLALSAAALFLIFTNASLGKVLGISHPLIQFASFLPDIVSDMNGFGYFPKAFFVKMIYGFSISMFVTIIATFFYNKFNNKTFLNSKLKFKHFIFLMLPLIVLIISGFYLTMKSNPESKSGSLDKMQKYEEQFKKYKSLPKPDITDVKVNIDLYPELNSYKVKGTYTLVNKTSTGISEILIYVSDEIKMNSLESAKLTLVRSDVDFKQYFFKANDVMQPGDSINMNFDFEYKIEPLNGHESFNAIVENGAFMRISNYFPRIGYNSDFEIDDKNEREIRNMSPADSLVKPDAPLDDPYNYEFINFDALISTSSDQTAVSAGELTESFSKNNRNYFHYKVNDIPFRFAVSSAEYEIKKSHHNSIDIEVLYHPDHHQNTDHLIEQIIKTLDYCENNFGKYPYGSIRFAEISSFTSGFAATAYPACIFINEKFLHLNLLDGKNQDIINELAGHELSHQWWGNAQLKPDDREGSGVLTETLAQYTELMLLKNEYGKVKTEEAVHLHKELYESGKAFSGEEPLYNSDPKNSNVIYNKGLVKMYELYLLLGEDKINLALKNLLSKHKYPLPPATMPDLISELKAVSESENYSSIDKLFKE